MRPTNYAIPAISLNTIYSAIKVHTFQQELHHVVTGLRGHC